MNGKKWIKNWFIIITIMIPVIGIFNYLIDPYGIYEINFIDLPKTEQAKRIRLVKIVRVSQIKPVSISLGTSRTEYAYDPNHKYFLKPSYNFAVSGASMYELKRNFEWALQEGNLKQVLLVVDYRMLNASAQKAIKDFDTYFNSLQNYKYLFSIDTLNDSFLTLMGKGNNSLYLDNGQNTYPWKNIFNMGGHLKKMQEDERIYYKNSPTDYRYRDTGKKSFPDFEYIVKKCYEKDIQLDIIFGPSHIRQWEALNYYLGYDKWLQFKKDVVLSVNKIAEYQHKKQFRIMDFSVYHKLTAERVPKKLRGKMKYHWDSNHYKNELGLIVLNRLMKKSKFKGFGVELNLMNIDEHLEQQKVNRIKFIDVEKYQFEVFGMLKNKTSQ